MKIRPQDKTPAERTRDEIERSLTAGYMGLRGTLLSVQRLVYQNPHGLTPQQVVNLMGTSAVQVFTVSTLAKELLNVAGEGITNVMPEGWDYEAHADGKVTLIPPQED